MNQRAIDQVMVHAAAMRAPIIVTMSDGSEVEAFLIRWRGRRERPEHDGGRAARRKDARIGFHDGSTRTVPMEAVRLNPDGQLRPSTPDLPAQFV